tara:strand:+ start:3508 stop:4311 length:804 start_codon:yes stop_codon:yes gene_type:complete
MGRLAGKVAIVTGAGSSGPGVGTGKATSILFAREGAKVLLVDMNESAANETLKEITKENGVGAVFRCDVTKAKDCQNMSDFAVSEFGRIDILFNNVGISGPGSTTDVQEDVWDKVLDINLKSMMLTSKYVVPHMIQTDGGSIINISSIVGLRSGGGRPSIPYAASKGGVIALTKSMAVQLGRDNVRVNCIAPGHIYTPMVSRMTPEMRAKRRTAGPLGTEGTAWDIAWANVFLGSDESRWISGITMPIDAGLLAATPLSVYDSIRSE